MLSAMHSSRSRLIHSLPGCWKANITRQFSEHVFTGQIRGIRWNSHLRADSMLRLLFIGMICVSWFINPEKLASHQWKTWITHKRNTSQNWRKSYCFPKKSIRQLFNESDNCLQSCSYTVLHLSSWNMNSSRAKAYEWYQAPSLCRWFKNQKIKFSALRIQSLTNWCESLITRSDIC